MCRVLVEFMCSKFICIFFFKQKTAYEMRISDWSSDVCSSDLVDLKPAVRSVHIVDYPQDWVERFQARRLYASDPIHRASHRTNVGFAWSVLGRASCRERVCQYV